MDQPTRITGLLHLCAVSCLISLANGWTAQGAPVGTSHSSSERDGPEYMVPFHTGRLFPTPQKAEYLDAFVPLSEVAIVLGHGVGEDDPRLALLLERISRYGGRAHVTSTITGDCDSFICVGDGAEAGSVCAEDAPAKPEGYLIDFGTAGGKPVIVLKGQDRLGLLWSITAINQMITKRDGRPMVQKVRVRDYPDTPGKRMYSLGHTAGANWLAVQCMRPNICALRIARWVWHHSYLYNRKTRRPNWRDQSVEVQDAWQTWLLKAIHPLKGLGIEWFDSIQPFGNTVVAGTPQIQIRSNNEEDLQWLVKLASFCAEQGGNFCLLYDDFRFPLHPDDKKEFGTAREADTYFIPRLYHAVKAKYPRFKLLWCPPFYWGPGSDASSVYGESREEYLRAVGERVPKEVLISWTGPRVKSSVQKPEHAQWITKLTKRKPAFWHNFYGYRTGHRHYDTDPIAAWRDWYYDSFFDDLALYSLNTAKVLLNMTLFDCLWNRRGYDPQRSIREAGKKIVGPEAYPKLVQFYEILASTEAYGFREPTALAARNVDDVKTKTEELRRAHAELEAAAPAGTLKWTQVGLYLELRERYLKKLLSNPNLAELTRADERVRQLVADETGADPATDIILTPNDVRVKRPPRYYSWRTVKRRFVTWINGQRSGSHRIDATFRLKEPPTSDWELVVCGLDHNSKPPCRIKITANGQTVFEGENPFLSTKWKIHTFAVPGQFLKDNDNRLAIENLEDSDVVSGPPWFMLNYVVVRPQRGAGAVNRRADEPKGQDDRAEGVAPAEPAVAEKVERGLADMEITFRDVLRANEKAGLLATGDLNGDGATDLAVTAWELKPDRKGYHGGLYILLQKQKGFAAPADRRIDFPVVPSGLVVGDFDRDGKDDLAVGLRPLRTIVLYLGGEGLQREHRSQYNNDSAGGGLAWGHLNAKGHADFLSGAACRKWLGGDRFQCAYLRGLGNAHDNYSSAVADVDGDGQDDLLFVSSKCQVRICYGPFMNLSRIVNADEAREIVGLSTPMAGRPHGIRVMVDDLNGDGQRDIVVARRKTLIYFQNNPTGFTEGAEPSVALDGFSAEVLADVNRDGLCDLIGCPSGRQGILVFLQKRAQPFRPTLENADFRIGLSHKSRRAGPMIAGDFDGDGATDLVSAIGEGRAGQKIAVLWNVADASRR